MKIKHFLLASLVLLMGLILSCKTNLTDPDGDKVINLILERSGISRKSMETWEVAPEAHLKATLTAEDSINFILNSFAAAIKKNYDDALIEIDACNRIIKRINAEQAPYGINEYWQREIDDARKVRQNKIDFIDNLIKDFDGNGDSEYYYHFAYKQIHNLRKKGLSTLVAKIYEYKQSGFNGSKRVPFTKITLYVVNPELTYIPNQGTIDSLKMKPVKMDVEMIHFKPYVGEKL